MVGEWNTRKFRQNRHVVELSTRAQIARFSLFDIHNNIIDRTFQDFAELVYCRCADQLIRVSRILLKQFENGNRYFNNDSS